MNFWSIVAIAAVAGVISTLQGQFMALMDKGMGTQEGVFVTYAGGGLVVALWMAFGLRGGNLGAISGVPWYALLSGLCGLAIVGGIGFAVSRIGPLSAMAVFLLGQFSLAILLDHFGWLGAEMRPVNWSRVAGLFVLMAGTWLVIRE